MSAVISRYDAEASAVRRSVNPSGSVAPAIISDDANWLEVSAAMATSNPPRIFLPRMRSGGKPSRSTYSTSAPMDSRTSTRSPMGRWCIRCSPCSRKRPGTNESQPVRKRLAVPALPTKIGTSFAEMLRRAPICTPSRRVPRTSKPMVRSASSA